MLSSRIEEEEEEEKVVGGFGCVNSSESFEDSEALDEQNMLSFAVDLRWLRSHRV